MLCLLWQPTSSTPQREDVSPSRGVSPRRLIKQAALESPPPQLQGDTEEPHTSIFRAVHYDRKPAPGTEVMYMVMKLHDSSRFICGLWLLSVSNMEAWLLAIHSDRDIFFREEI
jgi:hypothetical protein